MQTLAVGDEERLFFLSDLHLAEDRPATTAAFLAFLADQAPLCRRLVILGDLFEYWIGDDDDRPLATQIASALRRLSDQSTTCYFMAGNRDFLLGDAYAERAGMVRLEDPCLLTANRLRLLLMHGDTLCTDDAPYQAFRRQVRDPAWQADFLAQPLAARRAFATEARARSQAATAGKSDEIMDVNAAAVVATLDSAGGADLLHGHTHRPGHHRHRVGQRDCERWVLADWADRAEYLVWEGGEIHPVTGMPAAG
ncbi:MAG: UDP-2,3-diacylglucosamine diphosphatase [Rhodocyclaceae bacterium]|nr:UDP-2,3-diacylglucosamine diphosphatase [Rhodocyclaceae bacterium]